MHVTQIKFEIISASVTVSLPELKEERDFHVG